MMIMMEMVVLVVRMVTFKIKVIMVMQVREDLCMVHEAYQYFRFSFKTRFNTTTSISGFIQYKIQYWD